MQVEIHQHFNTLAFCKSTNPWNFDFPQTFYQINLHFVEEDYGYNLLGY